MALTTFSYESRPAPNEESGLFFVSASLSKLLKETYSTELEFRLWQILSFLNEVGMLYDTDDGFESLSFE